MKNISSSTLPPEQFRFIPGSTPTYYENGTFKRGPPIKQPPRNLTGYFMEDTDLEPGLTDVQTLFVACFATLIPLFLILIMGFAIRTVWRRCRRRKDCQDYDGVAHSVDSNNTAERPLHTHLLNGERSEETHLATDDSCDVSNAATPNESLPTNHSTITNGSIITMTLKNNHLIVETEERNDLREDSKETTMRYSPSARDGVFVVEVQQGIRRTSPQLESFDSEQRIPCDNEEILANNEEGFVIHQPPLRLDEESTSTQNTSSQSSSASTVINAFDGRTGLSQSTQSLTNQSYGYGNQKGYGTGHYGYQSDDGYPVECPSGFRANGQTMIATEDGQPEVIAKSAEDASKPIITAAIFKKQIDEEGMDDIQREQFRLGNSS